MGGGASEGVLPCLEYSQINGPGRSFKFRVYLLCNVLSSMVGGEKGVRASTEYFFLSFFLSSSLPFHYHYR